MNILRNTTAVLALVTGLTALPVLAGAQILGGSGQVGGAVDGVTGQVQGGVNGQVGVSGVQDTLGHTTRQAEDAASHAQSDVSTVGQQAGDTVEQAQGAAQVDGSIEAKGNAKVSKNKTGTQNDATAGGSVTVMSEPGAVAGAAASGVNSAKNDVGTIAGQARDTAQDAANATSSADLSAEAEAKADIEKK